LSKRGRSLVTIFAPTALRKIGQLQFHLDFERQNGIIDWVAW
jgi:4-carboxymuconolactone decarboxylase